MLLGSKKKTKDELHEHRNWVKMQITTKILPRVIKKTNQEDSLSFYI